MNDHKTAVASMEPSPTLQAFDKLPDSAIVRLGVVAELFGIGRSTVWRWVRKNEGFPVPRRYSRGCTAWRVGDLRAYLAERT